MKCALSFAFMGIIFSPFEIYRELVTVYGGNVITVQHVRKWCREFDRCRLNVKNGQRSGRLCTSASPVQNIDATVQAARCVNIAQLELMLILS
jgi:hypothetical protein